jgi:predicted MPP superfamily phosphohydrolase
MNIRLLIFLAVFFTIVGLSQWWAYRTFTTLFGHKRIVFGIVAVMIALSVSYIVTSQLRFDVPKWVVDYIYRTGNIYISVTFVLALLIPVWWLIGKGATIGASDDAARASRRDFLQKAAKVSLVAAYTVSIGDSLFSSQRDVIRNYIVKLPNLPPELEGVRIAQMSDLHVGVYWGLERFQDIGKKMEKISPDYLVITGDLVDTSPAYAPVLAEGLRYLNAKKECIAILGNHDHYAWDGAVSDAVRSTHFKLLRNEALNVMHNGAVLSFLGVEDPMGSPVAGDLTNESGLKKTLDEKRGYPLVLMHRPTQWNAVKKYNLPFAICGHTHAGQVAIPYTQITLANLVYKNSVGFYDEPNADGSMGKLFVHPGNGVAGVPIRLGCPPEIAVFELRRA